MAPWIMRRTGRKILETGVGILEYDGGVSYHGKCFVMDGRLSGIGSFNWDMRSAYLDTELMLVIDSEGLNAELRREMAEIRAGNADRAGRQYRFWFPRA